MKSRIHLVFHVLQLKKHHGPIVTQSPLPLLNDDGVSDREPVSLLDRRMVKRQGKAVTKVLVSWKNSFPEDSIWEDFSNLMAKYLAFHP